MQSKKVSYWWAALVGLFAIAYQVADFYVRFGKLAPDESSPFDFLWFFLGGLAGGAILVNFLNRASAKPARWIILVAFILGLYPAMLAMLGGGLIGKIGVFLLPAIVWGIFTGIGYLISRFFSK